MFVMMQLTFLKPDRRCPEARRRSTFATTSNARSRSWPTSWPPRPFRKRAQHRGRQEAEQKCCEASQALALAVSDVALSLKAVPVERRLDLTLQRNRRQRREVLRQWAQGQVRLQRQAIEAREEVHLRFRKSRISL